MAKPLIPEVENPAVTIKLREPVKMLCTLSGGLPRVAFERMNTNDLAECCWAIAPFFIPWVNRREESPNNHGDTEQN